MSKKTVRFIIVTQTFYAFMLLMVKYMINGFRHLEFVMVVKDLLFIVPATGFIIAFTILVYNSLETFLNQFKENPKKTQNSKTK